MKTENIANDHILLYSTYTILYCNDLACVCISELKPYIDKADKETKKIYGALMKRVKRYRDEIRDISKTAYTFYADFNSFMDEVNDDDVNEFRDSVIQLYYDSGLPDFEYLGALEAARTMLEFSFTSRQAIIERVVSLKVPLGGIKHFNLLEARPIMENLCNWSYRKAIKVCDKQISLTDNKEIMKYFVRINENLLNYDVFEKCYKQACELTNE